MKKVVMLLIMLTVIPLVVALEQPLSSEDLIFSIGQPEGLSTTIEGTICYKEYGTTEGYCSGDIRIYYQCLQRMEGLQWIRQSENCADYDGRCVIREGKATCLTGESGGFSGTTIIIIVGIIIVAFFIFKKK